MSQAITGQLWCIGRNYFDHAKELGNDVPSEPLVFLKSPACCVESQKEISLPEGLGEIHHEVELAFRLDADFKPTQVAIAIDLTARDLQSRLKKAGHPWTLAKSFQHSCPIGGFQKVTPEEIPGLEFQLKINDELRQQGLAKDMIFSISTIIDYLKKRFPIQPGDIILTGTPAGVGPIRSGDKITAEILGRPASHWLVK